MHYENYEGIKIYCTKHKQYFITYLKPGTKDHYQYEVIYLKCENPKFYLNELQFQKYTFLEFVKSKKLYLVGNKSLKRRILK